MLKQYTLTLPAIKGAKAGNRHSIRLVIGEHTYSVGEARAVDAGTRFVGQHPAFDKANDASKPYTCVVAAPEGTKFLHFARKNAEGFSPRGWADATPLDGKCVSEGEYTAPAPKAKAEAKPKAAKQASNPQLEAVVAQQGLAIAQLTGMMQAIAGKLGV